MSSTYVSELILRRLQVNINKAIEESIAVIDRDAIRREVKERRIKNTQNNNAGSSHIHNDLWEDILNEEIQELKKEMQRLGDRINNLKRSLA